MGTVLHNHIDNSFELFKKHDSPIEAYETCKCWRSLILIDLIIFGTRNMFICENFAAQNCNNDSFITSLNSDESACELSSDDGSIRKFSIFPLSFFVSALINNLDILFERKKLVWFQVSSSR